MCAAVLYGNGVVVAHSSRNYAKSLILGKIALFNLIEKLLCLRKFAVYLRRVVGVACHTHNAAQFNVIEFLPLALRKHLLALLWCESEFCLLLCYMYL